jgi:hypothetical protein
MIYRDWREILFRDTAANKQISVSLRLLQQLVGGDDGDSTGIGSAVHSLSRHDRCDKRKLTRQLSSEPDDSISSSAEPAWRRTRGSGVIE